MIAPLPLDVDGAAVAGTTGRIRAAIGTPGAERLVAAYYDPAGPFAGLTFDQADTPPHTIMVGDLFAVTMLDIEWRPLTVRRILDDDLRIDALLEAIPIGLDLWDAEEAALGVANEVWTRFRELDGVDWVTAGKLLARKRPRLIPVVDSVIVAALEAPHRKVWATLRRALQDQQLRADIERLRPATAPSVSLLRVLDVALWMLNSRSRAARKARQKLT